MQMSSFAFSGIIIKVVQWTLIWYQFYKYKLSKSRDMIVYHMSYHYWNHAIGCHGNRNDLLLLLETYTILWNLSCWTIFASIHIGLVKWNVRSNQHMTFEWHNFFCHAFPENVISCQLVPFHMNRLNYRGIRRPSVRPFSTFSNDFSSEAPWPILFIFHI